MAWNDFVQNLLKSSSHLILCNSIAGNFLNGQNAGIPEIARKLSSLYLANKVQGILIDSDFEWMALSQNFQNLKFLNLHTSYLRGTFPQRNWAEIISVWNESNFHRQSHRQDLIQHSNLWEQWNRHTQVIMHINWNFGNKVLCVYLLISVKIMLLESLNISIIDRCCHHFEFDLNWGGGEG